MESVIAKMLRFSAGGSYSLLQDLGCSVSHCKPFGIQRDARSVERRIPKYCAACGLCFGEASDSSVPISPDFFS